MHKIYTKLKSCLKCKEAHQELRPFTIWPHSAIYLQISGGMSEVFPYKNEIYSQQVGHSVFCDHFNFCFSKVVGQMVIICSVTRPGPISCTTKCTLLLFLLCEVAHFQGWGKRGHFHPWPQCPKMDCRKALFPCSFSVLYWVVN